jgi:hypothetical protein
MSLLIEKLAAVRPVLNIARRRKKDEKRFRGGGKRRRWVIKRMNSWHDRFRKFLGRCEKKTGNYLGLFQLAYAVVSLYIGS